ncbi:hypothetical protein EG68_00674 [Paragonimus skrjabini miyazakii]|uniref:Neuroendocrine protein 7B2 n=1 Tax=Paragonimus skrjabini miyazakii TaxID=59628 RepID=A0A8S9Z9U7_9TREM|nr:hypothetical protein EG68_00674 [Paragonimus skrjabini miyazakii]
MANWLVSRLCLSLIILNACSWATQYDNYIARLAEESQRIQDEFLRTNPRGQYVLKRLTDPDYVSKHPVLGRPSKGEHEIDQAQWREFVRELEHARMEAARADMGPQSELRSYEPEEAILPSPSDNNNQSGAQETASRRTEVAYQNPLWGVHKVSGGSSEIGQWLDYALLGAGMQDEDEEEEGPGSLDTLGIVTQTKLTSFKNDSLPAYCDPPNPCPIGYNPDSLPTPCDSYTEFTMEVNRNWILNKVASGECSCDNEHMESCSIDLSSSRPNPSNWYTKRSHHRPYEENPFLHGQKRKRLVAKKTFNPKLFNRYYYLQGKVLRKVTKKAGPYYGPIRKPM